MTPSSECLSIIYTTVSAAAFYWVFSSSVRNKRLWLPMTINLGVALLIVYFSVVAPLRLLSFDPFGVDRQELFVIVLLSLLFALAVEIPGFILNFLYDKKIDLALQEIADVLLEVRLRPSPGNLTRLNDSTVKHRKLLSEGNFGAFLVKCAGELKALGNSDSGLLNLLIEQVRVEQAKISDRSKHPFPVLIQIFGLSGVAFVLAEMLAILRMK